MRKKPAKKRVTRAAAKPRRAKGSKSKTPFADFLHKLHKNPALKETIRRRVVATFSEHGLGGEHVRALLMNDESSMTSLLETEARMYPGSGPHPLLTTSTLTGRGGSGG